MNLVGTRLQVMRGNAIKTTGGLTKEQLKYNKNGKIVSRKLSNITKTKYKGGGCKISKLNNVNKEVENIRNNIR